MKKEVYALRMRRPDGSKLILETAFDAGQLERGKLAAEKKLVPLGYKINIEKMIFDGVDLREVNDGKTN